MSDPFRVVRDFEAALCEYTGAPYAVTTTSCSMALLLAVAWHLRNRKTFTATTPSEHGFDRFNPELSQPYRFQVPYDVEIEIPKRTYVSVPMSIIHAGGRPTFRDEDWLGAYQLKPLPVWDSARWFSLGMYDKFDPATLPIGWSEKGHAPNANGQMICVSFHWSKTLGIEQGGAILHDDPDADAWLRRARFDGRTEGVDPKDDDIRQIGWHAYMSPEMAAHGLMRLRWLPKHNEPLPNDDYPDLSQLEIFR